MIIVLKQHAPDEKVKAFCNELQTMGYQINDSMGSDTHILGLIGDTKALSESWVLANPVVETCRRVSEPYKKANRKFHPDDTVVDVGDRKSGWRRQFCRDGGSPAALKARSRSPLWRSVCRPQGPASCAAAHSSPAPAPTASRGCVPRVWNCWPMPAATGQPIVTELMNSEHIPLFEETGVDMIQIGARNMQNFELLKAVGSTNMPVLLKRGLSATLEELS